MKLGFLLILDGSPDNATGSKHLGLCIFQYRNENFGIFLSKDDVFEVVLFGSAFEFFCDQRSDCKGR